MLWYSKVSRIEGERVDLIRLISVRVSMTDKAYLWTVTESPYASEFLSETKKFGVQQPVYIVDQYAGKRPALLDEEFFAQGRIEIPMYAKALLDSNVVNLIDRFVGLGISTDGWHGFIRFLTANKWDFSMKFYYLEHFVKSPDKYFLPNAIRRTESILKLFSMDEPYFLATGEIRPNPEAVSHYLKGGDGAESLSDVSRRWVGNFVERHNRRALRNVIDAIEICLIKMVLIRRFEMPRESPAKQYEEYLQFVNRGLGVYLARETFLAMNYFARRADKLLGIQPNTRYEKAAKIIGSTAWDMFFLRLPEMFLFESSGEICIAYIATQEKKLYELARCFSVERVDNLQGTGALPVIGFHLDEGLERLYPGAPDFLPSGGEAIKEVPVGLLEALHKQLATFCA